jgi:succinyl-CoA synthetase beta subunit
MQDSPALNEIEINPLMVRATGAVAADAVIWEAEP